MAIKLDELTGWKAVSRGDVLKLSSDRDDARKLRIHLNCEGRTWLYADHADNKGKVPQYLATVGPGVETVEFYVSGDVQISFQVDAAEGADQVWINTAELEPNVVANPNAETFTEIVERRPRNPELEFMQALAMQNQRLVQQQADQQRAFMAQLKAEREKNVAQTTPSAAAGQSQANPSGGAGAGAQSGSESNGSGSGGS